MGKVNNNPILQHNSGAIGKTVVYKNYDYGVVTSKYPDMSNVVPSEKQISKRETFAKAIEYAKSVYKDPEWLKNWPLRKIKGKTNFRIAVKEYLAIHATPKISL